MSTAEFLDLLRARGIHLEPVGGKLRVHAEGKPDAETYELIRQHKRALLALLEPARDASQDDCPPHWTHILLLPPKGARAFTGVPEKPERYRVKLFGMWYLLRFEPTISATHIRVTCAEAKCLMFADLNEFYRWAEKHVAGLSYQVTN